MRRAWRVRSSRSSPSTIRTIGRSRSTTHPSQVPKDSSRGMESDPGMCPATCAAPGRASMTSAPLVTAASNASTESAGGIGTVAPSRRGPALVRRSHPGQVARDRGLTGQQGAGERIGVHRAEQRVVAALEADRRHRRRGDPGRAERARPRGSGWTATKSSIGRITSWRDRCIAWAKRHRVRLAQQVGATDRADQQRTATEQGDRLVRPARVCERVHDVLRGVSGRVERGEAQLAPPRARHRW